MFLFYLVLVKVERRFLSHRLPLQRVEVEVPVEPRQQGKYFNYFSFKFRSYNYRLRQGEKMKELEKARKNQQPTSPMTKKSSGLYTSFVRRTSSMIRKLLPKNPESAIAVLKHVGPRVQRC